MPEEKNKVFSALKYLDFFSESISLNIEGHSVYRTFYGILFTVIYAVVMVSIVVTQTRIYLDRTNPIAVGETYSIEQYPTIDLYENKIIPVIVVYPDNSQWMKANEVSKYFTFKIEKVTWVSIDKGDDDQIFEKQVESFETIPCSKIDSEGKEALSYIKSSGIFSERVDQYGLCPQISKGTVVHGRGFDPIFTTLEVKIYPCSLAAGCVEESAIPKANFQLLLPATNFEASNYENPLSFTLRADDFYYVNPMLSQIFGLKLKQISVRDYIGLFPSWRTRETRFDLGTTTSMMNYRRNTTTCTAAEVGSDSEDCQPYFTFIIQSSGDVILNKRSYRTLAETVGSIGGTNGVIIVILLLLYGPINDRQRKEYVTRKIYSLVGVKEKDMKKSLARLNHEHPPIAASQAALYTDTSPSSQNVASVQETEGAPKGSWWRCCCCRKKTKAQIEWELKVKDAHERIKDSLDILTIVRNFNLLKVLVHFFFEERHLGLAQYVGLDLWREEQASKKRREKIGRDSDQMDDREEKTTRKKTRVSRRILAEKRRFNQWMDYLRIKHEQTSSSESKVKSLLTDDLDEFYFQNLAKISSTGHRPIDGVSERPNYVITEQKYLSPHQVPMDEEDRHLHVFRGKSVQAPQPGTTLPVPGGRISLKSMPVNKLIVERLQAPCQIVLPQESFEDPPASY